MKSSTALLAFLSEQPDHRFFDPEGRVNRLLRDAIEYPGSPGGMSQLLAGLEAKGQIHRVLHGRRCPVVELTPLGVQALEAEGVSVSATKAAPKAPSKAAAKKLAEAVALAEKKKPGRPKKAAAVEVPEKKKPGRPKKAVAEEVAPQASPRKKAAPAVVTDDEWETPVVEAAPEKRKPGRPRKVAAAPASVAPAANAIAETELLDTSEIAQALLSLVVSELSSLDGRAASEAAIREELAQSAARTEALEERARSLEDSLAYAKAEAQAERARADRLEKNLDAVMKGPDTSRGKEEARRQLERLISARPGR
jgi:DNA-binding MarR family transcriptional regulator